MKKPSLEEVKEYFKNAELVLTEFGNNVEMDINQISTNNPHYTLKHCHTVYSSDKGYAKILTYKNTEPKFEITKEQILELSDKFGNDNSSLAKHFLTEHLERMFPEVFETEPKHGEYWFHSAGKLVFVEETTALKTVKCRHIDNEKHLAFHGVDCMDRKATTEEVTEALKNEAVKRGYKKGICIIDLYPGLSQKEFLSSNKFDWELIPTKTETWALRDSDGNVIFLNGKWAEIIPTKTIQEAEELFKELGHNFKIV